MNKSSFVKSVEKSFDYAILEKNKYINAIKLDIPWSDLGSWREISKIYNKDKTKYFKRTSITDLGDDMLTYLKARAFSEGTYG